MKEVILAGVLWAGAVALSTLNASTAICSRDICWHTLESYPYPPEAGLTWSAGIITFREHEARILAGG
jgi:hypothetical protein